MSGIDDFQALLGVPVTPVQRRRQQASQARFDRAVGLVEQAARAAGTGDQAALDGLVARMDQAAFDDFEQCHPPSAALNYLLYEVVCDLVPDDADAGFGDTWVGVRLDLRDRLIRRHGRVGAGSGLGGRVGVLGRGGSASRRRSRRCFAGHAA
jgi:hypothetical protein